MTRYSPEHKPQTRQRLVEAAVTTLRRDGIENAGLKEIMQQLGLTVGGFYRHFSSKSELVQAAVEHGLAQSLERLRATSSHQDWDAIKRFSELYLSDAHRRALAEGCVLAALSSDIARGDSDVKAVCEEGLRKLHTETLEHLPCDNDEVRQAVWAIIALDVGGLLLARMVASDDAAESILDSCRGAVRRLLTAKSPRRRRGTQKAKKGRARPATAQRRKIAHE